MAFQPTQIVLTAAFLLLRSRQATAGKLAPPPPFPSNFPNLHRKTADSPDTRLVRALLSSPERAGTLFRRKSLREQLALLSLPPHAPFRKLLSQNNLGLCYCASKPGIRYYF